MTKAPTFHCITKEKLAPLGLSLSVAGAGAETGFGVSPKLSFRAESCGSAGTYRKLQPILLGMLTFKFCAYTLVLEGEASVSVDAEVINVAATGVANSYAQRDTRAALSGNT